MYFKQLELGPMQNYVYLIGDPATHEAAVVDPGWEIPRVLETLARDGYRLAAAFATHHHFDHVMGLPELLQAAPVPVHVHEADAPELDGLRAHLKPVADGETVRIGAVAVRCLHTPGHTPGSQCLLVDGQVFTGDTLFIGACGRWDLPGGDPARLHASLMQRLAALPEETIVYPGHNYAPQPHSTIGEQKRTNPFLQLSSVQEFLRKFVAAGGKLYSGTDSAAANTPGLALHHEMQLLVDAGIPPMQALQSSTKWAAEMARLDKKIGTVEAGKYGDVVILAADPLQDIHNTETVEQVIKGGVIQTIGYHAGYDAPFHQYGPVSKHPYSQPPVVSNLEPAITPEGSELWVRVTGANFSPNSVVLFDGEPVETQFIGDGELSGRLSVKQTTHPGNYLIGVETPKPGGGTAEGLGFIVDYK